MQSDRELNAIECTLLEGDYFDDVSVLYNQQRSRTINAATHVDTITLSAQDLKKIMDKLPADADKIHGNGYKLFPKTASTVAYMNRVRAEAAAAAEARALEAKAAVNDADY